MGAATARTFDRALAASGITAPQAQALITLQQTSPAMPLSQLAAALGQQPQSITVLADHLEKAGFVRRVADSTDRRVIRLQLTEAGRAKAAEAESVLTAVADTLLGALPDKQQRQLQQALGALERLLHRP
jgi:DNA-binding MarR family transcriptional regulator